MPASTADLDRNAGPTTTSPSGDAVPISGEWSRMHLAAGDVLFRPGDRGDSMYRIRSGRLSVLQRDPTGCSEVAHDLGPGETVGEMALLAGSGSGPLRTAEVRALTEADLEVISRAEFDRLADERPDQIHSLARSVAPRMRRAEGASLLRCYFGDLDAETLDAIEAALTWVEIPRGQVLFRQGDPSDSLYFVVHGCISYLALADDGSESVRFHADQGETIGEFGLLTGASRSATATARRDTALLRMTRAVFDDLSSHYPRVVVAIARNAFARQRRQAESGGSSGGVADTFALVPLSPGLPLDRICQGLVEALTRLAPASRVSSDLVDAELSRPGLAQLDSGHPVQPMFQAWLDEREHSCRYVVYQADPAPTPWTERCLRQADTVVLLGDGAGSPSVDALAPQLKAWTHPDQTALVLLHAPDRPPRGTAAWLDAIPVHAHYHLRPELVGDWSHLARVLTGRTLGLVLGGGGARGFGHVGVLRAMRELGLEPDYVGGVSIGALVGGLCASGMDDAEMQRRGLQIGSREALLDRTLPIVSLYETRKITRLLKDIFDDIQIEDLWRPYFAVSCNLSKGVQTVHRRGPLWEGVRGSMAATPIFTPLVSNGDLLVDGGYVNNLPVDLMRALVGRGTVIGIDCSPLAPKQQDYTFGPSISGWRALWERVKPFGRRADMPNMFGLFGRVIDTNGLYRMQMVRDKANLIVRLPIREYGMLDFDHAAEIIEIGYENGRRELAAWLAGTKQHAQGRPA